MLLLLLLDIVGNSLYRKKLSAQRRISQISWVRLTVKRYSIARSGLKKAALMARLISSLGKPMLSICAMTGSLWAPANSVEGSLKAASEEGWAVPAAAGEGVAGTAGAGAVEGAGAEGAAGVETGALEGVEGACEGVAAEEEALGCRRGSVGQRAEINCQRNHTLETMQTMNPFSSMLYVSIVLSSCRIFPKMGNDGQPLQSGDPEKKRQSTSLERLKRCKLTRIDELQLRNFPSFRLGDLLLYLSDLKANFNQPRTDLTPTSSRRDNGKITYSLRRFRLNLELLLLQILKEKKIQVRG